MQRDTFPYYGPFNEQTTQALDTIDQARFPTELYLIQLHMAQFVLSRYDLNALATAANRRVFSVLHVQL